MKKQLLLLAVGLFATATAVQAALVQINSTNFPDANFRNIVKGKDIDKDANNYLSDREIAAVTELYVEKKDIQNLKGIEFFTALEILYCYENQLTSLDLSKNSALTELFCYDNKLTSLDVSKNTALTTLSCHSNQLTNLDVSKNTALTMLYCYDNKLTSLDLTNNKALTTLWCYLNQIGHTDMLKLVNSLPTVTDGKFCGISISSSSEKNVLAKSSVEIAKGKGWNVLARDGSSNVDYAGSEDPGIIINATNFPDENFRSVVAGTDIDKDADGYLSDAEIAAVTKLYVSEKNIASLKGIEFFTALTLLFCNGNQLTSLDVSKNTVLETLFCSLNHLTSLDVSKNTALTLLSCSSNQLASLDVSKNTALTELNCCNNQIKEKQMLALVNSLPTVTEGYFDVISISSSTEKNVCTKPQVKIATDKGWKVYAFNGESWEQYAGSDLGITIDATNFPDENFRSVVAGTSIDKDANGYLSDAEIAAVTKLYVSEKNIASLKGIEFFTALTDLYCYSNKLTSLDVSKNTALQLLGCGNNQLTSLDLSKNTALQYLWCENNQLTSLDVSKNTALISLDFSSNQLKSLDVSKNTALEELSCYENQLTSLDVSKNTALTGLACFNNQIKEDKMQTLVNSLPTVTNGKFWVIDTKNNNEQNVCTKPQVKIATDKGWKVYDLNGGSVQEYTGSEPSAVSSIEVSAEEKGLWHSLDGKRLSGKPTKKGIYVRNGRKVVVK